MERPEGFIEQFSRNVLIGIEDVMWRIHDKALNAPSYVLKLKEGINNNKTEVVATALMVTSCVIPVEHGMPLLLATAVGYMISLGIRGKLRGL